MKIPNTAKAEKEKKDLWKTWATMICILASLNPKLLTFKAKEL